MKEEAGASFGVPSHKKGQLGTVYNRIINAVEKVKEYKDGLSGKKLENLEAHKYDGIEELDTFWSSKHGAGSLGTEGY